MTDRPHVQQAVPGEGRTVGFASGFYSGEMYGRVMQKREDGHLLPMGIGIGLLIAAVAGPLVMWLMGGCL